MPKSKMRAAEKDAIALLTADHRKIRPLLGELEETSDRAADKRGELLQTIERELKVHAKIEEEIFYPAFRKAAEKQDDKKLYYEALEEHHVVDTVLAELKEAVPASEEFAAKAKVLKDLVEHHAEEEETEMFPRARKLMSRRELLEMHERLAEAKTSLTESILTKLVELVRPS
jgi:hemerythrin-like domain-containing protein